MQRPCVEEEGSSARWMSLDLILRSLSHDLGDHQRVAPKVLSWCFCLAGQEQYPATRHLCCDVTCANYVLQGAGHVIPTWIPMTGCDLQPFPLRD